MKDLQQKIKDGTYFKESLLWYNNKFLMPVTHRSWILLIYPALIILLLGLWINIYNMFPLTRMVKYAIYTDKESGARAGVKKLGAKNLAPQQELVEIFASNYLKARESYNYHNLEQQFYLIKKTSTEQVFIDFESYMSLTNKESPLYKYQKNIFKNIDIESIKFIGENIVDVIYRSKAKDSSGEIIEDISNKAVISYIMDIFETSKSVGEDLSFKVVKYEVKMIKNNLVKNEAKTNN